MPEDNWRGLLLETVQFYADATNYCARFSAEGEVRMVYSDEGKRAREVLDFVDASEKNLVPLPVLPRQARLVLPDGTTQNIDYTTNTAFYVVFSPRKGRGFRVYERIVGDFEEALRCYRRPVLRAGERKQLRMDLAARPLLEEAS